MEQNREQQSGKEVDRFTKFMFGDRIRKEAPKEEETVKDADWGQLMSQLQDIASSVNNLRPMLKELSPLLDFFQSKKK